MSQVEKQEQKQKANGTKIAGVLGSASGIIGLFIVFTLPVMEISGDLVIREVSQSLTLLDLLNETGSNDSTLILTIIGLSSFGFLLSTLGITSAGLRTVGGLLSLAGGGLAYYSIEIAKPQDQFTSLVQSLGVVEFNAVIGVYAIIGISFLNIILGLGES